MEIKITSKSNGIHDYLETDIHNMFTENEMLIVSKLLKIIEEYNEEQIKQA